MPAPVESDGHRRCAQPDRLVEIIDRAVGIAHIGHGRAQPGLCRRGTGIDLFGPAEEAAAAWTSPSSSAAWPAPISALKSRGSLASMRMWRDSAVPGDSGAIETTAAGAADAIIAMANIAISGARKGFSLSMVLPMPDGSLLEA